MPLQSLIDKNIIEGFKNGDADIIRECFYGYCEIGYNLFDKRYTGHRTKCLLLSSVF